MRQAILVLAALGSRAASTRMAWLFKQFSIFLQKWSKATSGYLALHAKT